MTEIFKSPTAYPVFYRTYSRINNNKRETWDNVCDRTIGGIDNLGNFTFRELVNMDYMQRQLKAIPSGRWLWVGGTPWIETPENYPGAYNCTSTNLVDWQSFGLLKDLAMMGCGTGAVIEPEYIQHLPPIHNHINLVITGQIGSVPKNDRTEHTQVTLRGKTIIITVGDSRKGWVNAYVTLLQYASNINHPGKINIEIDISHVRPTGEKLQGFGGIANPIKLSDMFTQCTKILNQAVGRKLTSVECCLLIDNAALNVVAGSIRRSAGMRQFSQKDTPARQSKDNLWQQTSTGQWQIDPEKDALRMANHTAVFHTKPTLQECIDSVTKQYYSGEGAIQWAGEAVARANADILNTDQLKKEFLEAYNKQQSQYWLEWKFPEIIPSEIQHRLQRYGLNPCGEIIGSNFFCNLSEVHLNNIDPANYKEQREAFEAASLYVAALLNHQFIEPRYQESRKLDPIVGVSFTGLFDFFVKAFGVRWLKWWQQGRPDNKEGTIFKQKERDYLASWKDIVYTTVAEYCDRNKMKCPNRCTTVQPAGTKSLLTGASPGWHPPKAARFIRRITFTKNDPIALACIDYGYSVTPSQSDKDENGILLNDPFDPRVTEWLVEIPIATSWADIPEVDTIDISKFSALAQFDFAMQVQQYYTGHNTSSTIELTHSEIEPLANAIYNAIQEDQGYISFALMAKFDDLQTFPRLPFEPITKETYEQILQDIRNRRTVNDFAEALAVYDKIYDPNSQGPAGCDSDKCLIPTG